LFASVCDGQWLAHRENMLAHVLGSRRPSSRRRAAIAQVVAEAACFAGDGESAERLLAYSIEHGLFDLPWLDRCPVLAPLRARSEFPALRAQVATRADAILDALYGDNPTENTVDNRGRLT